MCWVDAEEETEDPRKMCSTCEIDDWGPEEMEPGEVPHVCM